MFMGPNVIVADQCDEDQYGGDHYRDDFYAELQNVTDMADISV